MARRRVVFLLTKGGNIMGWWSEDIMGGDTPLDIEIWWKDDNIKTDQQAYDFAVKACGKWGDDPVTWQVTGWLMIRENIKMSQRTADKVIEMAEADEWAAEGNRARQEVIDDFIEIVRDYVAGKAVSLPHQKGLFEVIANKMAGE